MRNKKYTYEEVKEYIENNSDCKLLSTEYINNSTDLKIECSCGKTFNQTFNSFKNSQHLCNECRWENLRIKRNYSYEEVKTYIENNSRCILLSKNYINMNKKINLKCSCGRNFETSFSKFKNRNKRQCNECSKNNRINKYKKSYEEIKTIIESESNCKLLSKEYINNKTPLLLKCYCGNKFKTSFKTFKSKNKKQCRECTKIIIRNKTSLKYNSVKSYINSTGNKLLSLEYINTKSPLLIQCKECGKPYYRDFSTFKTIENNRCNICSLKTPKGEIEVINFLTKYNIKYIPQKRFKKCKYKKLLAFDFYLINKNIVIEVDGQAHYFPVQFGGMLLEIAEENFKLQKIKDNIKTQYCIDNKIKLIRIPYTQFNNIEEILTKELM